VQVRGRGTVRPVREMRGALQVRVTRAMPTRKAAPPAPIGPWLPVLNARVMCQSCHARDGAMFYQCVKPENLTYWITKIRCEKCARVELPSRKIIKNTP